MDSCLIILEQKDDAFISKLQLTMKDQASSSIEKEESLLNHLKSFQSIEDPYCYFILLMRRLHS